MMLLERRKLKIAKPGATITPAPPPSHHLLEAAPTPTTAKRARVHQVLLLVLDICIHN
uniref:Uncharacterized protein n=1 Tax=Arundo donax TaxID=35708 RepID=A0A0A9A7L6_ARUDO